MNFDLNALANIAKMLGGLQNTGAPTPSNADLKPQNAPNPFDKSKNNNLHTKASFASQNGLGEKIDVKAFSYDAQKQNDSANGAKTPMENLLGLMNKKKDFEKMMPAFANIFSSKQQKTAENTQKSDEKIHDSETHGQNNAPNRPKQKENGKPENLFSPIEFAGYTLLSAFNRLYFNSKN